MLQANSVEKTQDQKFAVLAGYVQQWLGGGGRTEEEEEEEEERIYRLGRGWGVR